MEKRALCGRNGYFAGAFCSRAKVRHDFSQSNDKSVFHVNVFVTSSMLTTTPRITTCIRGNNIKFIIGSGASVNIINQSMYTTLGPNTPQLQNLILKICQFVDLFKRR